MALPYVQHGTNANAARTAPPPLVWIGLVDPVQAEDGDFILRAVVPSDTGPDGVGPSAVAPFVHDTFTDADGVLLQDHAGETGAVWAKQDGSPNGVISAGRVRSDQTSGADVRYYASGVPASADYDVEIVCFQVGPEGRIPAPMGRMGTGGDLTSYRFRYSESSPAGWVLTKRLAAGESTNIGAKVSAGVPAVGSTYTLRLELRGDQIRGYVDGVLTCQATDSDITHVGQAGIFVRGGAHLTSGAHAESLTATDA